MRGAWSVERARMHGCTLFRDRSLGGLGSGPLTNPVLLYFFTYVLLYFCTHVLLYFYCSNERKGDRKGKWTRKTVNA